MNRFWRIAPWLTRLMLVPPTLIFALIASRYFFDPVHTGATIGLAFNSPLAITITRVGFGAFPLACSIFTLSCLVSTRRDLIGDMSLRRHCRALKCSCSKKEGS
jgi:hypothetical protein